MTRTRTLRVVASIVAGAFVARCAPAQTVPSAAALEPLAFLTAHEWNAELPASPQGKKTTIHARFTWTESRQAIRISSEFVTEGKATPYVDGLYAWDPERRGIVFWYVGADGSLTQGSVKAADGQLVHEFQEAQPDGKTAEYVARVTPHANEAWDNEIFARTPSGLAPLVKVRYEIAK